MSWHHRVDCVSRQNPGVLGIDGDIRGPGHLQRYPGFGSFAESTEQGLHFNLLKDVFDMLLWFLLVMGVCLS